MKIRPIEKMLYNLSRRGDRRFPDLAAYEQIKRTPYVQCLQYLVEWQDELKELRKSK